MTRALQISSFANLPRAALLFAFLLFEDRDLA